MSDFILSELAGTDIDDIETYIAADNPEAARQVTLNLRGAMRKIAELPGIGHRRPDVPDPRYRVNGGRKP